MKQIAFRVGSGCLLFFLLGILIASWVSPTIRTWTFSILNQPIGGWHLPSMLLGG